MSDREFESALDDHLSALCARDIARFGATLGADVTVVDGRGNVVRGRDHILASHAAWFASPDSWTFAYEILFTRQFIGAGLALIDVTYRQTPQAVPARFLLSLVFERDGDGAWRFVYDQNTTLAPHD